MASVAAYKVSSIVSPKGAKRSRLLRYAKETKNICLLNEIFYAKERNVCPGLLSALLIDRNESLVHNVRFVQRGKEPFIGEKGATVERPFFISLLAFGSRSERQLIRE